jgi:RNA polymerase sigma-70 factor (ECF subfamily)
MDEIDVYEILVREHEPMLLAYVCGLVHDHALAEDVCQEAFIQGFRKLSTLQKQDSFAAWIRAIARNAAFGELRRRGREAPTQPALIAGMEEVFTALDRDDGGGWQSRVQALRACFDLLPEPLRACCRLHYFDGRATADIASSIGSSLAAVLKRLQRAREALATCIGRRLKLAEER